MRSDASKGENTALVPFLLGGIVGAAVGLLLAPKSGREMRKQIKELASDARGRISSTVGKGMNMYDNAKMAVSSAVVAGKQAYLQEREKFQALR